MLYYGNYEDYKMNTTVISTNDNISLKNGPVQFGDDWPGTFLSISFIKENIKPAEEINPTTVFDAESFSKMYIHSIYNSLVSGLDNPAYDHVPTINDVSSDVQEITSASIQSDGKILNRVETGFVTVNDQHGYFIRGDNSGYILYTLSLRKSLTPEEIVLRDILSHCIVGGFQFKS